MDTLLPRRGGHLVHRKPEWIRSVSRRRPGCGTVMFPCHSDHAVFKPSSESNARCADDMGCDIPFSVVRKNIDCG